MMIFDDVMFVFDFAPVDYGGLNRFRSKTGLPVSTYFSAVKLKWMLDNNHGGIMEYEESRRNFGTIDSWIVYNLTGGHKGGGVHITDGKSSASFIKFMILYCIYLLCISLRLDNLKSYACFTK